MITHADTNATTPAQLDEKAQQHFHDLTSTEQRQAICDLTDAGQGDYIIAAATRLSVEMVRQILGERA
jgi:DNA-binding NarL/FixJ family response regulator